jgi:hypothetical protein
MQTQQVQGNANHTTPGSQPQTPRIATAAELAVRVNDLLAPNLAALKQRPECAGLVAAMEERLQINRKIAALGERISHALNADTALADRGPLPGVCWEEIEWACERHADPDQVLQWLGLLAGAAYLPASGPEAEQAVRIAA